MEKLCFIDDMILQVCVTRFRSISALKNYQRKVCYVEFAATKFHCTWHCGIDSKSKLLGMHAQFTK